MCCFMFPSHKILPNPKLQHWRCPWSALPNPTLQGEYFLNRSTWRLASPDSYTVSVIDCQLVSAVTRPKNGRPVLFHGLYLKNDYTVDAFMSIDAYRKRVSTISWCRHRPATSKIESHPKIAFPIMSRKWFSSYVNSDDGWLKLMQDVDWRLTATMYASL